MKLTGTNRPITYTTHHPCEPVSKGVHDQRVVQRKQDCLRPLCGSRTTNQTLLPEQNTTKQHHNCCNHHTSQPPHRGPGEKVTAVIAWGKRPVPFRTRKLRPTAPMVLHPGGCGRVGHRRTHIGRGPNHHGWGLPHLTHTTPASKSADHQAVGCPLDLRS